MEIDDFVEMAKEMYEGSLPTGIKQLLAVKLLLNPNTVNKINLYCNGNKAYNKVYNDEDDNLVSSIICGNVELYKTLWLNYISEKLPKYKDMTDLRLKYAEESKLYNGDYKCKGIIKNPSETHDIIYNNAINTIKIEKMINSGETMANMIPILEDMSYYDIPVDIDTILIKAIYKENRELISYLVGHGANINYVVGANHFLFFYFEPISVDFMKFLVNLGLNINYGSGKLTPMIKWISHGTYHNVNTLLEMPNIDINGVDGEDKNALFHIATHFSPSSLKLAEKLLKMGINVNHLNMYNRTALYYVEDDKMLKLLLKYGADINNIDVNGDTPFIFYLKQNYPYTKNPVFALLKKSLLKKILLNKNGGMGNHTINEIIEIAKNKMSYADFKKFIKKSKSSNLIKRYPL